MRMLRLVSPRWNRAKCVYFATFSCTLVFYCRVGFRGRENAAARPHAARHAHVEQMGRGTPPNHRDGVRPSAMANSQLTHTLRTAAIPEDSDLRPLWRRRTFTRTWRTRGASRAPTRSSGGRRDDAPQRRPARGLCGLGGGGRDRAALPRGVRDAPAHAVEALQRVRRGEPRGDAQASRSSFVRRRDSTQEGGAAEEQVEKLCSGDNSTRRRWRRSRSRWRGARSLNAMRAERDKNAEKEANARALRTRLWRRRRRIMRSESENLKANACQRRRRRRRL